jgi:hypothetical protein
MKTADGPSLAIVGVTGAVGQEFLRVSSNLMILTARKSARAVTCYNTRQVRLSHVTAELAAAGAEAAGLSLQQYQDACICQVIHVIAPHRRHAAAAVALGQMIACWVLLHQLLVMHRCYRSAGKKVDFDGEEHTIEELTEDR